MQPPIKAVVFALCFPAFVLACDLQPLSVSGKSAHTGPISVRLGEADDPHHPSAWQGPLQIAIAGKPACTASSAIALIEQPLLLGNNRVLFVPTYSGNANRVYAVDVIDCRVLWKSHEFSGTTSHRGNMLVMGRLKQQLSAPCLPYRGNTAHSLVANSSKPAPKHMVVIKQRANKTFVNVRLE